MKSADPLRMTAVYVVIAWGLGLLGVVVFVAVRMHTLETDNADLLRCVELVFQCPCQQTHALAPVSVRGIPVGPTSSANPDSSVKDPL